MDFKVVDLQALEEFNICCMYGALSHAVIIMGGSIIHPGWDKSGWRMKIITLKDETRKQK